MTQLGGAPSKQSLHHVDDLDIRILQELGGSSDQRWHVRESFSSIARRLGIDEETVRMRVNRARERGLLPVWRMMVNPLLLNCRAANIDLAVKNEGEKADVISKIKALDGVNSIADFRGRDLLVGMYFEDEDSLARNVLQLESICESPKNRFWESLFPTPRAKMNRLDWEIINEMQEDARKDLEAVANRLKVTVRTVQRRLSMMMDGKAVYLARPPNVGAIGGLLCQFLLFCSDRDKKQAMDRLIHSSFARVGASDTSPEQYTLIGMSCENFAEADRVMERLTAIDGVENVKMRILNRIILAPDWLRQQVEARLKNPNLSNHP